MTKATDNESFARAAQEWLGVPVDGHAGIITMAAFLAKTGQSGVKVTPSSGGSIPYTYWPLLAKIESGTRPYAKASTSSASGLYQFIKSTWIGEGGKWGPDRSLAFGGLRPSEAEQLQRVQSFTARNAIALKKAGIPINEASLYAAHFLGVGMAIKIIGADVNSDAGAIAGEAATKANPSILKGKTVGDFLSWLHKKTGAWAR